MDKENIIHKASELIPDEKMDQFWIRESRKIVNRAIKHLGGDAGVHIGELRVFFSKEKPINEICNILNLEDYGEKQGGSLFSIIRAHLEEDNGDYA